MYNKKLFGTILLVTVVLVVVVLAVTVFKAMNWDLCSIEQLPLFRVFAYGISKPLFVEASQYPYPITWDRLDEVPQEYASTNGWFDLINNYSLAKLKKYMQENNLSIVPKDYALDSAMDIDELIQQLEFSPST